MPARLACAAVLAAAALSHPPCVEWASPVIVAEGRGERGAWRQDDTFYDYVDDATVAIGPAGDAAVAWVDQRSRDVFFRTYSASGQPRAKAVNVSLSPATFSWQPRIAIAQGRVYLLWQEIIFSGGSHGGDILFAHSSDGGASFSVPINVSNSRGGDGKGRIDRATWSNGSHDLALASDGSVLAAWTEYDGMLWTARSADGGASFSAPRLAAGGQRQPARAPSLASGGGRRVYLAWTAGGAIHLAQSDDAGASFGKAHRVSTGPGFADAPRLAVTAKGILHLVYAHHAAGAGGRFQVRHARSSRGLAGFGRTQVISGPQEAAAYPAIAVDGADTVYVSWERFPAGSTGPRGLALAISGDQGARFSPPQQVAGSEDARGGINGSHQGLLGKKLAADGAGNIALVNSSLAPGTSSRVWLLRGRRRTK